MDFSIIVYIILGITPSLVWLSFYLKEDLHPEPKKMILNVFFWGAFTTVPVFFIQIGLNNLLEAAGLNETAYSIIYWFAIIAFSEELFKYLVVRIRVFDSHHLDEPLDLMLYMVVSALGFAAVENTLYILSSVSNDALNLAIGKAVITTAIRFIGATFLHTLCSAVIGYSLAIYFQKINRKKFTLILGILTALGMHGLYNYCLVTLNEYLQFVVPTIILLILALLVFTGFSKLQNKKGVCEIE